MHTSTYHENVGRAATIRNLSKEERAGGRVGGWWYQRGKGCQGIILFISVENTSLPYPRRWRAPSLPPPPVLALYWPLSWSMIIITDFFLFSLSPHLLIIKQNSPTCTFHFLSTASLSCECLLLLLLLLLLHTREMKHAFALAF